MVDNAAHHLGSLALEAHELGGVAEAKRSLGDAEAREAHEAAATKFLQAARIVRDPTTRRAIALVGHAHARRAACLRPQPKGPPAEATPAPTPPAPVVFEPPTRTLCVPDLLALERRLHSLGVGGRARPTLKAPTKALARRVGDESPEDLLAMYVGEPVALSTASTESAGLSDAPEAFDREEAVVRAMKRLSDENGRLRRERDALAARCEDLHDTSRAVDDFRAQFSKKFETLKAKLEDFHRDYPNARNPANALYPADPQPSKSYSQLQDEVVALQRALKQERDFSGKKDAIIRRYEFWYHTLKASATRRTNTQTTTGAQSGAASDARRPRLADSGRLVGSESPPARNGGVDPGAA